MAKDSVPPKHDRATPPVAGLPAHGPGGQPLKWAGRDWAAGSCAGCGAHQDSKAVILCGRCAAILADHVGPQVVHLTPAEQLALNRKKALERRRRLTRGN